VADVTDIGQAHVTAVIVPLISLGAARRDSSSEKDVVLSNGL
jgi:hypothetical protein